MNLDLKSTGNRIKELRHKQKWKQRDLAEKLGVTRAVVSKWEAGLQDLKTSTIIDLAQCFNVSTDYLLGITTVKTFDIEKMAICSYLGISEKCFDVLHNYKEISNGRAISNKHTETIIRLMETVEEYNEKINQFKIEFPEDAKMFCEWYGEEDVNKREKDFKKRKGCEPFKWFLSLRSEYQYALEEIEMYKTLSVNDAKYKLSAINKLFSDNDFDDFLSNLVSYINVDFESDTKMSAVLINNDNSDTIECDFSSKILSGAFFNEIQRFITNLREKSPTFTLNDLESIKRC